MGQLTQNENLVAFCGLYCKNCGKYKKGKCPGCEKNEKASWCTIRACCIENKIESCAQCNEYQKPSDCKKFNNFFSKIIQFATGSNRELCINIIKEKGRETYISTMESNGRMSLPKRK